MFDLDQYREEISGLCKKFGIRKLEFFGSSLTEEFNEDSDIDCLIEFAEGGGSMFHRHFDLKYALEELFGREVDIVMAKAMKNPYFIEEVNSTKQLVYAA